MTATPTTGDAPAPLPAPTALSEVEGWFFPVDQVLFDWFLTRQRDLGEPGDLLEVGVYLGKSAIFTGSYLRAGDAFTVCDLFEAPAGDAANSSETQRSYPSLTRHSFEANYLSFHDELPRVIEGPSTRVREEVAASSCRFAHIDASHLYEHVRGDIEGARALLHPHGIVALDDYRSEHTPGVAAATWQAVTSGGLHAVCVTGSKLYGTWGDPAPVREQLVAFLEGRHDIWHAVDSVAGGPLVRVRGPKATAPAQPRSRHRAPETAPVPAPVPQQPAVPPVRPDVRERPARSRLRRLAVNVMPPFITKGLVRVRDARRDQA
jgi:hypothetical protein